MALLGVPIGCGFEQPFEALHRALFAGHPENEGFLRPGSILSLFFFMDEDDCSVADPILLDPGLGIFSTAWLGPLDNYRCARFGLVCDQPWPDADSPPGVTTLQNCRPRRQGDPMSLLHPVHRTTEALLRLRDPAHLLVTAFSGPPLQEVVVEHYEDRSPRIRCACGDTSECAGPAVRLPAFLAAFDEAAPDGGSTVGDICARSFAPWMSQAAQKLRSRLDVPCLPYRVEGCPDPPVPPDFSESCSPVCRVLEIDAVETEVEPCAAGYRDGHPPDVDPALPQAVCYHILFDSLCEAATGHGGGQLRVSRRVPASSTARIRYACVQAQ
jgi:hypothetical protein